MTIFNNREIAVGIWTFALFVAMFAKKLIGKKIKDSVLAVLRQFLNPKILIPTILMAAYTIMMIFVLRQMCLWDMSLLKDSIVWFCVGGFVTVMVAVTTKQDDHPFRKIIASSIKFVVILEFIINTYTFPLIGEFFLVPVASLIAMMEVVSNQDEKHAFVAKLMRGMQIVIGFGVLYYALTQAVADYKEMLTYDTLKKVLLIPLLTIMFLPFVFIMLVYSQYEQLFIRLEIGCKKDVKVKRYAKRRMMAYCLLNLKRLNVALNMSVYNVMSISTKSDVDDMIEAWRKKNSLNEQKEIGCDDLSYV